MSKYVDVLNQLIQKNYPTAENQEKIIITNIQFQILYPRTSQVLQRYENLKTFIINNCDLRNLQNFPLLLNLQQLDLANNQLQGTFNHLMKCKNITYINLSNNIISEVIKLAPLKRIGNITICIKDNPLCSIDGYAYKIKTYNLKIAKSPKKISQSSSQRLDLKVKQKVQAKNLSPPKVIQRSMSDGNHLSNLLLGRRSSFQREDQFNILGFEQRRNRQAQNRNQLDRRLERLQSFNPQKVRRIRQRLVEREQLQRQRINHLSVDNPFLRDNRYSMANIRMGLNNRTSSQQTNNIFFRPNAQLISDSPDPSSLLNQNQDNAQQDQQDAQQDENISKSEDDNQQEEEQEEQEEEEEEDVNDQGDNLSSSQSENQLNILLDEQNSILRRRINIQMNNNQPLFLIDRVNMNPMSDSEQIQSFNQNDQINDEDEDEQPV